MQHPEFKLFVFKSKMYSLDRRKMATNIYTMLKSYRKTASLLQVCHSTVFRWLKGMPRNSLKKKKVISKADLIVNVIKTTVEANPFVTAKQLCKLVKDNLSIDVSRELTRVAIKKLGYTKKKARFYNVSKNQHTLKETFLALRNKYIGEGRTFVSIDETSFGRNGFQVYGYKKKGERLLITKTVSYAPTKTVIAAITSNELLHKECIIGSCNALTFLNFIKQLNLPRHSVIIMDNARIHHSKMIKEYCNENDYDILFSPPYSPWFNPIEFCFSIVKRHYYQHNDIELAFHSLTPSHVESFYKKSINCENHF